MAPSQPVPLSALDRLWRDRPYMPRAVAILTAFIETDDAVTAALDDAEREVAASLLADSYRARDAFSAAYSIEWGVAVQVFRAAMLHAATHPLPMPGEEVIYAPTERLLARLGYCDGLGGYRDAPVPAPGRSPEAELEEARAEADPDAQTGLVRRVETVFNVAYEQGFAAGEAERALRRRAPGVLDLIDARAELVRGMVEAAAVTDEPLEDIVAELPATLGGAADDAADRHGAEFRADARRYAMARVRAVRDVLARARVLHLMQQQHPVSPLAIGAVLRVLEKARANIAESFPTDDDGMSSPLDFLETRDGSAPAGARRQVLTDQVAEATLLAATVGLSPETVAACRRLPSASRPGASVPDIIFAADRDVAGAKVARRALRALSTPVPGGRWWGLPQAGVSGGRAGADELVATRAGEDPVPVIVATILEREGRAFVDGDRLRHLTLTSDHAPAHDPWTDAPAATLIVRQVVGLSGELIALEPGAVTLLGFARREAAIVAHEAQASTWEGAVRLAALRAVAAQEAQTLVAASDPDGWARIRAECDLALRGTDGDLDTVEQWVRAYRKEAAMAGAARADFHTLATLDPTHPVADAVLLLARARLLERALSARANQEAWSLYAAHSPQIGIDVYAARTVYRQLEGLIRRAGAAAARDARELARLCPQFGERICWELAVVALDRWHAETGVAAQLAEELEALEGAAAPESAPPARSRRTRRSAERRET